MKEKEIDVTIQEVLKETNIQKKEVEDVVIKKEDLVKSEEVGVSQKTEVVEGRSSRAAKINAA